MNASSPYLSPAVRHNFGRALLAGVLCWPGVALHAQNQPPPQPVQAQPGAQALLTQEDLKEMLAPIALYPDALIALILPASTVPSDIVLGSRFVERKTDPALAAGEPWDDSVKSLVYYPDVLSWMNENLEWTAAVGEAFMDQPADVMNAIQSLRAQARASGALKDTPQQQVVVQEEVIRIIPADPEVIYVPQYDPEVIFVETYQPSYTPIISFGIGFAVGSWLNYDCDWRRRSVWRGDWVGWNRGGRGWDRGGNNFVNNTVVNNTNINVVNINSDNAVRWNPGNRSLRQREQRVRNGGGNVRFATPEARAAREVMRAERRNNNGRLPENVRAEARRAALPNPDRLEVREAAFNRSVRPQNRPADQRQAEGRREQPNAAANVPPTADQTNRPDRTDRPNPADRPNRPDQRRRTPSEAPQVDGQLPGSRELRRQVEGRRETPNPARQEDRQNRENRRNSPPTENTPPSAVRPTTPPSNPQTAAPTTPGRNREQREERRTERPQPQTNRQQQEPRQSVRPTQPPTQAPQIQTPPAQRPAPSERPGASRSAQQNNPQQREQRKIERPQQRPEQPRIPDRPQQRQETRPQQNQPQQQQRQRAEQPQQRQESRPKRQEQPRPQRQEQPRPQRQEVRQKAPENKPQRQEIRQPRPEKQAQPQQQNRQERQGGKKDKKD